MQWPEDRRHEAPQTRLAWRRRGLREMRDGFVFLVAKRAGIRVLQVTTLQVV